MLLLTVRDLISTKPWAWNLSGQLVCKGASHIKLDVRSGNAGFGVYARRRRSKICRHPLQEPRLRRIDAYLLMGFLKFCEGYLREVAN